ncbi:hypothetical protein A989_02785 [Xanthomonas translucens DAR61454]|nr:hypothetical protein NZ30_00370 [Xanthomonas translucens pv. undulosa]ELQ15898.1 hypothetical protein A989_02785 [Xanthomonas translucens DAR61454]
MACAPTIESSDGNVSGQLNSSGYPSNRCAHELDLHSSWDAGMRNCECWPIGVAIGDWRSGGVC